MATTNKDFRIKNGLIVDGVNATVNGNTVLTNAASINALSDVTISSPTSGQVLKWNGSAWINDTDATGEGGAGNSFVTVSANGTSVVADTSTDTLTITPGDGLSIDGNATSDTITFTPNIAGASANGIVTTGTQTFAGEKTFSNTITASANIVANTGFVSADAFRLDTTYTTGPSQAGEITWDPDNETAQLQLDAHTIVQIGQEQVLRVKNSDGANAIPIRTAVMFAGADGDTVTVARANSANITVYPSDYMVGITAEEIAADGVGFVTQFGTLPNVNTAAFTLGNLLYVDPANPGQFVTTRPSAPAWQTPIAAVTRVGSGSSGRILVRTIPGIPINRVEGVEITSATQNDVLRVNANGIVVNSNLATAGIANLSGATFTGNVAGTNISVTGNVNATTFNGNLSATQISVSSTASFNKAQGSSPFTVASTTEVTNLTAQFAGTANVATQVNTYGLVNLGGDANVAYYPTFVDSNNLGSAAAEDVRTDSGLAYYPTSNILEASGFKGSGSQLTNIPNSATTASDANGASTIVARDANGSFVANVVNATTVNSSTLRLTSTTDVTTSSTTHAFQIGPDSANNIRIDDNEISRYNNGVVAQLNLNIDGGDVVVGASTSNVIINGSTQLGLEETQAVVDVNNSYTYLTNTYTVNLALGNYFSNITLSRAAPAQAWTFVGNTRTTTTGASGTFTLPSGMQNGDYVAIVIGCDSTGTYPNVTTTTYGTWAVTSSGSTTHPARLFVKRITDAANETSVAYTTTAGATAIAAMAIRNAASTLTVINNTTAVAASFNPPATTTSLANSAVFIAGFTRDIAVTAVTHANTAYNGNLAFISTSGLAAGVNAAVMISFATVPTVSAEDPATFTVTGGTAGNSAAFSAAISSYVDPTINLINGPTGTYLASTYVLHINNPASAFSVATTWSGATFAWQGGTAPTLSTIAPNNIVILETIDGSTFRGALLDSYA